MKSLACFLCFLLAALRPALAAADAAMFELGDYADDRSAQAAWRPMRGTAPAAAGRVQGRPAVRLPCNFAGTTFERASWDHAVAVDLASARGIRFDFFCADPAPVGQFSIYFQSGNGWYSTTFQPEATNGWCTVAIDKNACRPEGQPAGWNRISTIRVSAWRGRNTNTEICLAQFRRAGVLGVDAEIAILRAESAARASAAEARSVDQFTDAIAAGFESFGVGAATINDVEVTAASQLRGASLIVLPYNPALPAGAVAAVRDYLNAGGRLLAFYHLPPELQSAVGIEMGRQLKAGDRPGRFAAIRFAPGALAGAPLLVKQRSWNIREAKPTSPDGRILAEWLDDEGHASGAPAVVATTNAVVMTHVLLDDDRANQRRMLLAMAGRLVPDLWRQGVTTAIERIGRVGGNTEFETAAGQISRQAGTRPAPIAALAQARVLRDKALALSAAGKFADAMDQTPLATQRMLEAFCLAQRSVPGEFRAFWCHSAFGVEGIEWDEAIKRLADAGFTAIFPNMLWGGVAFYPSRVLPVAPDVAARGDQIAKCLAACKKYGVQMHVWKVNWNTGRRVPAEFLERMRREGRLQMSSKGKEEPWLCPSHPDNQALEIASMLEVARDYAVDGIHFDYIRYPDGDHCFCGGCRARFEKAIGAKLTQWPQDALGAGARRQEWLDWRRNNITTVVRGVSEQVRAVKPKLKISAAVFRNWTTDRDGVGQDWKLWCERGWLDFVCPMDYTNGDRQFDNWVALQREWAGRTPVYPGIGVSSSSSRLPADRTIGQIEIARRHGTGGFIIFNYGAAESRELLPLLGLGMTAATTTMPQRKMER